MSTQHGPITIKPINEVAEYLRNLIPPDIPGDYALKPMFEGLADEQDIRNGIIAFRDFLYLFCDCLITKGDSYAKPPKKPSGIADYPFLHNITNLLVDIGYHGKLAEDGKSLLVTHLPLCAAPKPKIPVSAQIACLRFLTLCGFLFAGVDLEAKTIPISETQILHVSYPAHPALPVGLRAMAIADMELRTGRRYWNDNNLLRCDYRLLKAENTDMLEVLQDFLHPLPPDIQKFALKLHQRYTDMGLTCVLSILSDVSFAYVHISEGRKALSTREKYQQRVWEFCYSLKNGYCLFVRAKKTDKYTDVIAKFPLFLREKIATGYGCYRKLGRERCQGDCQGICLPLNDSILEMAKDIETWLDCEAGACPI